MVSDGYLKNNIHIHTQDSMSLVYHMNPYEPVHFSEASLLIYGLYHTEIETVEAFPSHDKEPEVHFMLGLLHLLPSTVVNGSDIIRKNNMLI